MVDSPLERHTYEVRQHLRCASCGVRYLSGPIGATHRSYCLGIAWTHDGEPHFYIDGLEVSEWEFQDRCPLPPPKAL